mgnify:CR=1 FL=1|jgi:hypothetical protein|tara:strand:+ start:2459 stop:2713 length:255 start_codon:yes stop_codon:yes gene_type:complete
MFSTKNLTTALEELVSDLDASGKQETAKSFRDIIVKLSEAESIDSCNESLEKLTNSGAISQYANFSYKQDELFDVVFDEAKKLK